MLTSSDWLDVLNLCAWGQAGVLTRFYLGRVLGGACGYTYWVPCVTSPGLTRPGGALFTDLPANILGCFIMGVLSTSDQLLMLIPGHRSSTAASTQVPSPRNSSASPPSLQILVQSTAQPLPMQTAAAAAAGGQEHSMQGNGASCQRFSAGAQEELALETEAAEDIAATDSMPPYTQQQSPLHATAPSVVQPSQAAVVIMPAEHTAAGQVAALQAGIPLAVLPCSSPLQHLPHLALGLRTGYCGCLTTFASWMLQMVVMMVGLPAGPGQRGSQGSEWVAALAGLLLGCLAAYSALICGQSVASWAAHAHAVHAAERDAKQAAATAAAFAAVPKQTCEMATQCQHAAQDGLSEAQATTNGQVVARKHKQAHPARSQAGNGTTHRQSALSLPLVSWLVHGAAALMLCVLTAVSLAYAVTGSRDQSVVAGQPSTVGWFSILLSPAGTLLRWRLSKLNGSLRHHRLSWAPAGTWAANMLACALDFTMQTIHLRADSLSHIGVGVLSGIITGIGGSLSTVSTWVVELQKLYVVGWPRFTWAGQYAAGSILPAVLLGLVIYGTAVWTA